MSRVTVGAPESVPESFREPRMVAIEASRRAAERLWWEIGLLVRAQQGQPKRPAMPQTSGAAAA
jgi:hypothetical protein